MKKNTGCVCIVPFYNEKKFIFEVLDVLLKIPAIDRIICVDDGSTDGASDLVKKNYPAITLVVSPKNEGKSQAIKRGLDQVKNTEKYVFLIDADLRKLNAKEIEKGVEAILNDSSIDMLIFKRSEDPLVSKIVRFDVLISGERILKTDDLKNVFKTNPNGFQIEVAINLYMMENRKKTCWVDLSAKPPFKPSKRGIAKGVSQDIGMFISILTFMSYKKHIESILTFCAEEYSPEQKQGGNGTQEIVYAYVNEVLKRLLAKKNYFNLLFGDSPRKGGS